MLKLGTESGRLDGRKALVTGAASGIGRAMVLEFAARGAAVTATDLDLAACEAVRDEALASGAPAAVAAACDVRSMDAIEAAVAAGREGMGGLDVVCSNAGILDGHTPLLESSEEQWDSVLDVNVKATWRLGKATIPGMLEAGKGGAFVVTASVAGMVAGGGGVAYTTSKHAVIGLMRQIAYEHAAQGIRVNAICPGVTETGMTQPLFDDKSSVMYEYIPAIPSNSWAQPEEMAKLAAFLVSDDAPFIHGACFVADGGWTMK